MIRVRLERWINRIWYASAKPPLILRTFSGLHKLLHLRLFDKSSTDKLNSPGKPLIVVGNLVAGGTGKTPAVIALVEELTRRGLNVSVISRGYGRKRKRRREIIQVTPESLAEQVGDEPLLIAQRTGCAVWVSDDRRALVAHLKNQAEDVIISDDGLQSRSLWRSYEICVVSGERGFGNGYLLPAGPLRDPIDRLKLVDHVLLAGDPNPQLLESLDKVDVATSKFPLTPMSLCKADLQDNVPLNHLAGRAVRAVCGIGQPQKFINSLESLGMCASLYEFPDHYAFSVEDMEALGGDDPIVVTEKDWTKLQHLPLSSDILSVTYILKVKADLDSHMIDQVEKHVRHFYQHD